MNIIPLLFLTIWQLSEPTVVAPAYPTDPHADQVFLDLIGVNFLAVAVLEPSDEANSRVVMLVPAETPATRRSVFVDAVKTALNQWRLPGIRKNKKALVVVTFRDWVMFSTEPSVPIQWEQLKHSLPLPTSVTWPVYPEPHANKHFAMPTAVILHLQIDVGGHVSTLRILRGTEEANKAAIEAVKQWKFFPAHDESGKPAGSDAYAVCVYRPLLLQIQ